DLPKALQGRFVFLSVFDWTMRKGWDLLLRAYCTEFQPGDGAGLLLKITRKHSHSSSLVVSQANEALAQIGQSPDQRPDIVLSVDVYAVAQLAALYHAADALFVASLGDGCGRSLVEKMASGLPTTGTGASCTVDFMSESHSF